MLWVLVLAVVGLGGAGDPKAAGPKPPWQRLLTGADVKKAADLQERANQLEETGRDADAAKVAEELLDLRVRLQGADHWEAIEQKWAVVTLKALAALPQERRVGWSNAAEASQKAEELEAKGAYDRARPLREEVLKWCRAVLGENHPTTAAAYNNLAFVLDSLGKPADADPLYRKALDLFRATVGADHPETASALNNVAHALRGRGRHVESEAMYRAALDIRRRVQGEDDPDTAQAYNNLAHAFFGQGRFADAEPLFRLARDVRRRTLGESHTLTASSAEGLAGALSGLGRHADAEPLFRAALAVRVAADGDAHPDTAFGYNNVAICLSRQDRFAEAEPLQRKALAIWRDTLGEAHPDTAKGYANVAHVLGGLGRWADAEPLFRKALEVRRQAFGEGHPDTAQTRYNLAHCLAALSRWADIDEAAAAAVESYEAARTGVARGLDRAALGATQSPRRLLAVSRARAGRATDAWAALEADLARGMLDHGAADDPTDRARRDELRAALDRLLPRAVALTAAKEPTDADRRALTDLRTERAKLEAELVALAATASRRQVADLPAVRAALAPSDALVAYISFNTADGTLSEQWGCVVRRTGDPVWVRLPGSGANGTWGRDDWSLITRFRTALTDGTPTAAVANLAKKLADQRLTPLEPHLTGVNRLVVVPVHEMAGLPFEALTDKYTIAYAPSGTVLARLRAAPKPTAAGALAVGDPVFARPAGPPPTPPPGGLLVLQVVPGGAAAAARIETGMVLLTYGGAAVNDPAELRKQIAAHEDKKTVAVTLWREGEKETTTRDVATGKLGVSLHPDPAPAAWAARRKASEAVRGGHWAELPGAAVELSSLAKLFGDRATVLSRADASTARLSALQAAGKLTGFRYVHLATHGTANDARAFESALILAGERADARLTAGEVLTGWKLDAELVTLSACETALGRAGGGDGLLGFAQAFLTAGSRAVCLSLWKVDDAATALLMDRFYQNLLGKRAGLDKPMGKASALAEAKRWLRDLEADEAGRLAGELTKGVIRGAGEKALPLAPPVAAAAGGRPFAHPRYWAGFVLIGDPD